MNPFLFTVLRDGDPAESVLVRVVDSETLTEVVSGLTNASGEVSLSLDEGLYIAVLAETNRVFNQNNTPFSVYDGGTALENSLTLDGEGVLLPPPPATPSTVLCSAYMQGPGNLAQSKKGIYFYFSQPYVSGGVLFFGRKAFYTNTAGYVQVELPIGSTVLVGIEGVNYSREFVVPNADFNLFLASLSPNDTITLQTPAFPVAPVHS